MFSRKNILYVLCCIVLTLIVAFFTSTVKSYFFDRYDYDLIRRNENLEWSGPKEGEKIELSGFKTETGEPLQGLPEKTLILLSVVDPKCEMCVLSSDLAEQVRDGAQSNRIKFFVISYSSNISKEEFFKYAKTFGNSDGMYFWQGARDLLLPDLQNMVIPSYLLIDEKGVVLRRFPGSSREKKVRNQMARQIIAEISAEKAKLN